MLSSSTHFWGTLNSRLSSQCQQSHPTPSRDRFCTGCRRWERISGSSSYFANSWNLVILSLEKDLADIYNDRLGSSGGETDGGLLILHTVKNYTVAPAQLQHEEKTNQHGNTCREEIRTKGKSKPWRFSHHGTTQKKEEAENDFKQDRDMFVLTQDKMQLWSDLVAIKVSHAYKQQRESCSDKWTVMSKSGESAPF